jgi:hypothetical protein
MNATSKRVAASVAAGALITSVPLVLGVPFYGKVWFKPLATVCDWPMMLAKNHLASLLQGNETDRLLEFFSINIVVWSILISCVVAIGITGVRNARGN